MPSSITLNGNITFETCAVCQEPNIKVEHGHSEQYHNSPAHYEHCPNCGTHIVLVGYYCQQCAAEQINQAELLPDEDLNGDYRLSGDVLDIVG